MANGDLQNASVVGMKKKFPRPFGRYILEKSLSRGGMGEVMLALPRGMPQRCVIKTIRGDLTGDEEFIGRFADEAKIMVRMAHENIIRVFDAGRVESDYYIAMEFVYGRDLGDVLDRAYERGEPLPTQIGLYISSKLLDGLAYVHDLTDEHGRHMGLVHRDISPQNVLIGFDGSIKLIDFGLARTDILPARTQGALAVGKYGYMSPEQARHEKIDGRADIYSTGVMLFEVFTGDRLVDEQDQATLWQRVLSPKHRNPRSVVPSLPKEIDELVMTSVAVRPDDRFAHARAMKDFTDRQRRAGESTREKLIDYLRYLYPKVDFAPPPLPDLSEVLTGTPEKSIIIATSREAQRSVFGRGELPIEGTMQFDASALRAELARRRNVSRDKIPTDSSPPAAAPKNEVEVEATYVRPPEDPVTGQMKLAQDAPTMIAHFPQQVMGTEETVFNRPGGDQSERTLESAPVRNLPASPQFRDDEMTVMMDAPPRVRPPVPEDGDVDAPTRLSKVRGDADATPQVVQDKNAASRRDIRERPRDVVERSRFDEPRDKKEERRPPPPAATGGNRRGIAVHRATVPQQSEFSTDQTRSVEEVPARTPDGAPEGAKWSFYVLIGAILVGVAFLVFVIGMLLFGE